MKPVEAILLMILAIINVVKENNMSFIKIILLTLLMTIAVIAGAVAIGLFLRKMQNSMSFEEPLDLDKKDE
jgi:hypothetical protein